MTSTTLLAPTLANHEDVQKVIALMSNPEMALRMVRQMDMMELQLGQALKDLDYIKNQLDMLQQRTESPLKQEYQNAVQHTKNGIYKAQESCAAVKKSFLENCKKALNAAKTQGAKGIDKALNLLGVKKALLATQERIDQSIQRAEQSIDKVHALGNEYHAIGYHAKRIASTFKNQEVDYGIKANGKINDFLKKPFEMAKRSMQAAHASVERGLSTIGKIEQTAQKGQDIEKPSSIQNQLAMLKAPAQPAAQNNRNLSHER